MSVDVYYFSGTGNSLVVARDIAEKAGANLISIPSITKKDRIKTDADIIGVVFPVHGFERIPSIVERFVGKLDGLSSKYIFTVSTYGNMSGMGIKTFSKAVESCGGRLSAGFAVHMPMNNITIPFMYNGAVGEKEQKLFVDWHKKCDYICDYVAHQRQGRYEVSNRLLFALFYPIDKFYGRWRVESKYNKLTNSQPPFSMDELWPFMDVSFHVDEKCDSCAVCSRICPVDNIKMVDGKPVWQHHCERCLACLQWCPKEAIQFNKNSIGRKRYHHPSAKLSDMLMQRN